MEEEIKEETKNIIKERHLIGLATIKKIMKKNGIMSISKEALIEVQNEMDSVLEESLRNMANSALVYTKHRGKKVTNKDDLLLVLR